MGGGGNGYGSELLGVTSNKSVTFPRRKSQISYIPQTEQHSPFGLMLLHLGNVIIVCLCVCVCVCVCVYVCVCVCVCVSA